MSTNIIDISLGYEYLANKQRTQLAKEILTTTKRIHEKIEEVGAVLGTSGLPLFLCDESESLDRIAFSLLEIEYENDDIFMLHWDYLQGMSSLDDFIRKGREYTKSLKKKKTEKKK